MIRDWKIPCPQKGHSLHFRCMSLNTSSGIKVAIYIEQSIILVKGDYNNISILIENNSITEN